MEPVRVVVALAGVGCLLVPATILHLWFRAHHRLRHWTRVDATIDEVIRPPSVSSVAVYSFHDTSGRLHVKRSDRVETMVVGHPVEVMYDPEDPTKSEPTWLGNRSARFVTYGTIGALCGGLGLFLLYAALGGMEM